MQKTVPGDIMERKDGCWQDKVDRIQVRDSATVHKQPGNHSKGTSKDVEVTAEEVEQAVKLKFKPYATFCRFKTRIYSHDLGGGRRLCARLPPTDELSNRSIVSLRFRYFLFGGGLS